MAHTWVQAEELESERLHLVQVARATAGDVPDTAKFLVDRRGNLAELGAEAWRWIAIPADRDFRAWHRGDVAQVVTQEIDPCFPRLGRCGTGLRSHRIADDRAQVGKEATNRMGQKADVPRPNIEELNGIRDRRRVVSPQRVQLRSAQGR